MKKSRYVLDDEPKVFVVIQKAKPHINDKKDAIKKAASDKKDANGKRD